MNNFITNNQDKNLKDRLKKLISKANELKFLVGFFYFSGLRELYEALQESYVQNPNLTFKILVGMDIDIHAKNLIEFRIDQKNQTKLKSENFFKSVEKSLTHKSLDNQQTYEQADFFQKLLKENKLIIRKTSQPNHAKLYLFKLLDQVSREQLFITGSSNLTKPGILSQAEFNIEIADNNFKEAEEYFDEHWKNAVEIEQNQLIETITKKTFLRQITPFEAFVYVLKTYLDGFLGNENNDQFLKKIAIDGGFQSFQYQIDAVKQAKRVIEEHNGVIIADVVGLGKSVIASLLATQLKGRGMIICPPGLVGDINGNSGWKEYCKKFKLDGFWQVRSLGNLPEAFEYTQQWQNIETIIIDEAHRFRNEDTQDYRILKNICRDKKVILLTATPFNNSPSDIFSLLALFTTPKKSSITLNGNVKRLFDDFENEYKKLSNIKKYYNSSNQQKKSRAKKLYQEIFKQNEVSISKVLQRFGELGQEIKSVIEPVIIRRNRIDLQNNPTYKEEVKNLAKVANPKEWFFELNAKQSNFYDKIITQYFGAPNDDENPANIKFKGAIYRPYDYQKGLISGKKSDDETDKKGSQKQQQRNLYDLMRRLLVKRFESSFVSFEASICSFKKVTQMVLNFVEKNQKYILDRKLIEKLSSADSDEIEIEFEKYAKKLEAQNKSKNHQVFKIDKFVDEKLFIDHIKSDIALFDEILEKLTELKLVENDPKIASLIEQIKNQPAQQPKRKIVIFSEYAATAKYLGENLAKHFANRVLLVKDLSDDAIAQINQNFDAALSQKNQKDDYDILVATDKISEGFNLNRAGMVINYDIPWNPVRVIQRLGRINRISKKVFDQLFIVNFFPTQKGEDKIKSRQIAEDKMMMIHAALGEDAKIFNENETPTASELFSKLHQNPENLEDESFYTKMVKKFAEIKAQNPQIEQQLQALPKMLKVAKQGLTNELLVFAKKNGTLFVSQVENSPEILAEKMISQATSFEKVFANILCQKDEKSLNWNNQKFWQAYEKSQSQINESFNSLKTSDDFEAKAQRNLQTILRKIDEEDEFLQFISHKNFIEKLLDDINNFGTLSQNHLRQIVENDGEENPQKLLEALSKLEEELGKNYLKNQSNQANQDQELVIAIQNLA
jgi:superfamily II DNA or RNA helicase